MPHLCAVVRTLRVDEDELTWLDCLVALLALPSLLLLALLMDVTPRTDAERVLVLCLATLLLFVSVLVCCYVKHRLDLGCCQGNVYDQNATESWQSLKTSHTSSYDTFINMEPRSVTSKKSADIPSVHTNKSWTSLEQGCYQTLRPQGDNG